MANQGLNIAPPPRKPTTTDASDKPAVTSKATKTLKSKTADTSRAVSFENVAGEDKVQFNKRITRNTADGFEMLAIKTRKKVPQLLEEALEMLENKYGKS
jgi:hypothetical protein